jgi:hypothetical protein
LNKILQRRNERESGRDRRRFHDELYHAQVGALETQEFRTTPVPFWIVCFSDSIKGPMRQMYFVVLLPDGTVVVPKAKKSM